MRTVAPLVFTDPAATSAGLSWWTTSSLVLYGVAYAVLYWQMVPQRWRDGIKRRLGAPHITSPLSLRRLRKKLGLEQTSSAEGKQPSMYSWLGWTATSGVFYASQLATAGFAASLPGLFLLATCAGVVVVQLGREMYAIWASSKKRNPHPGWSDVWRAGVDRYKNPILTETDPVARAQELKEIRASRRRGLLCLGVACAGAGVSAVTGVLAIAVLASVGADFAAAWPTIKKIRNDPSSESATFFFIEAVAAALSIPALGAMNVVWLGPLSLVAMNLAISVSVLAALSPQKRRIPSPVAAQNEGVVTSPQAVSAPLDGPAAQADQALWDQVLLPTQDKGQRLTQTPQAAPQTPRARHARDRATRYASAQITH